MGLNNSDTKQLRETMVVSFTEATLDIFVQDYLNVVLDRVISMDDGFEMVCQRFIRWADGAGRLADFLQAGIGDPPNPDFGQLAAKLIANAPAVATLGGANDKPYLVRGRPLVDREPLWRQVTTLGGAGANRVLVVNGGVGKSHSVWMLSYLCDQSLGAVRLVSVDAQNAKSPITPGKFANLLASRLWESTNATDEDSFAADTRDSKALANPLINRLSALETPTWLVIDELDLVNLEHESLELLGQLCRAVDRGECRNVWLFLIGLDPTRLDARIGRFLPVDVVTRPVRNDIEKYVMWFAGSVRSQESAVKLAATVDQLDATLQTTPNYADWDSFHELLREKCASIRDGIPL